MLLHNFSHYLLIGIMPPGLILIIMLAGFILNACKIFFGKILVGFGFLLLWLLSTQLVGQTLIDGLQHQYKPLATNVVAARDAAIVVLGMGIEPAAEYEHNVVASEKTLARVHYAAYFSKKTGLPIVVSGGNQDPQGHSEASIMAEILKDSYAINVAALEDKSRNTEEQSRLLLSIMKANNIHTVYLVTNGWHMPRSIYAFESAFKDQNIKVIAAPMGFIALKSQSFIINLMPFLDALQTSAYAMYEYIGICWYHLHRPIYS